MMRCNLLNIKEIYPHYPVYAGLGAYLRFPVITLKMKPTRLYHTRLRQESGQDSSEAQFPLHAEPVRIGPRSSVSPLYQFSDPGSGQP